MEKMNRRSFLKYSTLAGLGAMLPPHLTAGLFQSRDSYSLYTCNPEDDVSVLLSFLPGNTDDYDLTVLPVARPVNQDITIVREGTVIDPAQSPVPSAIKHLCSTMRKRSTKATHIVSLRNDRNRNNSGKLIIRFNGKTIEEVDMRKDYNSIIVPGIAGNTEFKLSNSNLSVVKSSCNHQVCSRTGTISSGSIICAPNRIVATLPAGHPAIDGITR